LATARTATAGAPPARGKALVAKLMPSRPWRIAIATTLLAVLFPASRLILLLILGACFIFVGPAARWAKKNRLVLALLILGVPALFMGAGYVLTAADRIDFDALQPGTYTGHGVGKNPVDPLEVTAVVGEDGSLQLSVTAQSESGGRPAVERALTEVPAAIASSRSLEVDAISGATFTTDGIIQAGREALAAAGGAGEQPWPVLALQWLTEAEPSRETLFQLCIIFGIVFLLDFMLSGVLVRNTGESLNCYNCQACVGVCPVGRVEDDVPLPMTMVLETRLGNYARVEELAKYCVGCARCAARCPNGISAVSTAGKAIAAKRSLFEL
jgi:uncharacterized protein with FMN-binding domain/NAD-dependent dihydropyrimidine dehydrogenase PreA subunit